MKVREVLRLLKEDGWPQVSGPRCQAPGVRPQVSGPRCQGSCRLRARPAEGKNWAVVGHGLGIRWPALDEELSVAALLLGATAPGAARRVG